jgi:hypothetical protein
MATIENFILRFKVEGAQGVSALKGSLKDIAAQSAQTGTALDGLIGRLGPIGAAAGAAALAFGALGMKAINLADEIQDMSDATGIGADQLLGLRNSMIEAGGNSESMGKAVAKLSVAIGESLTGNDKYQKSFKDLGVVLRDTNGQTRDAGDVLTDTLTALRNIEDDTVRAAKAVELFGKEAAKLDLTKLSAPKDLASKEQIAALAMYRGEIDKLKNSIDDALISAFGKLAIAINKVDWTKQKSEAADYLKTLGSVLPMLKMAGIGLEASVAQDKQAELMKPYRSRAGVGRDAVAGDQGGPSEATLKAIADSKLRIEKNLADAQLQIDLRSANETERIELQMRNNIANGVAEIRSKERLSEAQKAKEILSLVSKETEKSYSDIAKIRRDIDIKVATETMAQAEQDAKEMAAYYQQVDQARLQAFDQVDAIKKQTEELQGRFDLTQKILDLSTTEQERQTKLFDLEQQRKQQLDQIAKIKDYPYNERLEQEKKINAEYEKQKNLINEVADARNAREQEFSAGIRESMKRYEESLTPLKQGQQMAESVFSSMGSALDKFVETGKFNFGDFAKSVIQDLIKIQLRAAATQLLSAAFGSFFPIPGKAIGGPVQSGQPYIVGERGPELFMPNSAGTIVPNDKLSGGAGSAGGSTVNNYYTISAIDAKSVAQLFAENKMTLLGTVRQAEKELPFRGR